MNAKPAHAMYGEPVNAYRQAAVSLAGAKLQAGGGEYVGRNRCIANEDTCEGPKAKGTDYCVGHLRSRLKSEVQ
jgi:hypothetical protein